MKDMIEKKELFEPESKGSRCPRFKVKTESISVADVINIFSCDPSGYLEKEQIYTHTLSNRWSNSTLIMTKRGLEINLLKNHSNGMSLIQMIKKLGVFICETELQIGIKTLTIKIPSLGERSPQNTVNEAALIGMIDMLCVDREGNIVIVDLKARIVSSEIHATPHEKDVVRVQFYAYMFDFIARKLGLNLSISYCAIMYWNPESNNSSRSEGFSGLFTIKKDFNVASTHCVMTKNIKAALNEA
jgi:hypothetical protein